MLIRKKHRTHPVLLQICILLTVLFSALSIICVGATLYISRHLAGNLDPALFTNGSVPRSPRFFAYQFSDRTLRKGEATELTEDFFAQQRNAYVPIEEIPQALIDAFVAIEDKRFFTHGGVDLKRTAAAALNYILGFSDTFGGSTVTQQLVKNMTGDSEISIRRKLQEILYATELERILDKNEIMELYLNVIHFSDHCNGIAAAAEHYFSKPPSALSVQECATIAAITNNPSYYNPIRNPENNLARRNLILREMHENGMLSEEAYSEALAAPLGLCVDLLSTREGINSWYADMVIEDVIADLSEKYGLSRAAASHLLYTGGVRIDVAMDAEIQKIAEEYYTTSLRLPENGEERAQSSLIVIDPHTGDILAVVGAAGKKTGNHLQNFATMTKRAPGSTIKPISVYAPAMEEGLITLGSVFDDVPTDFFREGHTVWPQNATRIYRGLTDVSYAVAHSTNTVAVRVLRLLGKERAFQYAKERFHLEGLQGSGARNDLGDAALGLGQLQHGVSLRELTAAYTVFADEGVYHPTRSYYRVLGADGTVLLSNTDHPQAVLGEGTAAVMTKLLEGVVRDGTSGRITLSSNVECAGKTGTSGDDHDRWFIGYTPDLLCGVWCGYPYPQPLKERHLCTTAWNGVMERIVEARDWRTHFEIPPNVVSLDYCRASGLLPCHACTKDPRGGQIARGWFVLGTEPRETCSTHVLCRYDTENGGVIHGDLPLGEEVALLRVERHFPFSVTVRDAQFVWRGDPSEYPVNEERGQPYFHAALKDYCGVSDVKTPFNRSAMPPKEKEMQIPPVKEEEIPIPWFEERRTPA